MKAFKLIEAVRQIKSSALPEIKSLQLLAHAQTQFAREYRDRITSLVDCGPGSYTTHLLNALEDDFRVALLFWGPGSKSSIHDHGQTLGAVTPVVGVIHETQYEVLRIENRQASLAPLATIALDSSGTTPISPDTAKHAHCLANNSDAWVATIHVYLAPLTKFHAYQPDADGTFTMMEKTVRYERDNEWRRLEPNVGVRGVEQPRARSTVARPPRSLAAAL